LETQRAHTQEIKTYKEFHKIKQSQVTQYADFNSLVNRLFSTPLEQAEHTLEYKKHYFTYKFKH